LIEEQQASNKRAYNSDFCGNIPINFINLIQPQGALVVIDRQNEQVIQASENTEHLLGVAVRDLIGQTLDKYIGQVAYLALKEKSESGLGKSQLPFSLRWQTGGEERQFFCSLHPKERYWILELEPEEVQAGLSNSFASIYQEISFIIAELKEVSTLDELYRKAADSLRELSGFDRVMIYRFDEEWNGTVIAESMEEGAFESYLGLRFPASDVPRQARELYTRTPYRIIADATASGVGLYPVINPLLNRMLSLSDCVLRAVPLVHAEYLQNMGVRASMSTPIIIDNKLWGLISCHQKQPKHPSFELRSSFEIISGILASQIGVRVKETEFALQTYLQKQSMQLIERFFAQDSLREHLTDFSDTVMQQFNAAGLAWVMDGHLETAGSTPDNAQLLRLTKWLSRYQKEKISAISSLPHLYEDAKKYADVASGLLAIHLGSNQRYLLLFRPEQIKTVQWGGNPNEALQFEPGGKKYHPRNSFRIWQEQVAGTAEPWQAGQLEAAGYLRTALLEIFLKEDANTVN
jgi:chemotaxis family two-component system sensor kinase Cph1